MKKRAKLTSRGRMTIPAEVRRRLGLETGDCVEFSIEGGRAVLHRIPATYEPFSTFAGALGSFADQQDVVGWVRQLRSDETR
jgi:AbrB family looped-hinge helix DNA binding protein